MQSFQWVCDWLRCFLDNRRNESCQGLSLADQALSLTHVRIGFFENCLQEGILGAQLVCRAIAKPVTKLCEAKFRLMHSCHIYLDLLERLSLTQIYSHIFTRDLWEPGRNRVAQVDQIGVVEDWWTWIVHIGSRHFPLIFRLKHEISPRIPQRFRCCCCWCSFCSILLLHLRWDSQFVRASFLVELSQNFLRSLLSLLFLLICTWWSLCLSLGLLRLRCSKRETWILMWSFTSQLWCRYLFRVTLYLDSLAGFQLLWVLLLLLRRRRPGADLVCCESVGAFLLVLHGRGFIWDHVRRRYHLEVRGIVNCILFP